MLEVWCFRVSFGISVERVVGKENTVMLCFGLSSCMEPSLCGRSRGKGGFILPLVCNPLSCEDLPGKVLRPQPALDILIAPHGSNAVDPLQLLHSPKSSSARVHNYMCIYTNPV